MFVESHADEVRNNLEVWGEGLWPFKKLFRGYWHKLMLVNTCIITP
jgi:hypothetical protein